VPRSLVHRALTAAVVAAVLGLAGCGGDDGPEPDPDAFCALAPDVVPVEQASPEALAALIDVAPEALRDDLAVLRSAADRLAEYDEGDPAALEAEFEIRFDPEYAGARDLVESAIAGCARSTITTFPGADPPDTTVQEDAP